MDEIKNRIECLFDRFNIWETLTPDYWAILIGKNPDYINRSELKILSVPYDAYILMEYQKEKLAVKFKEKNSSDLNFSKIDINSDTECEEVLLYLYEQKYVKGYTFFTSREWMLILSEVPDLIDIAKEFGALNVMDDYSKSYVIFKRPELKEYFATNEIFKFPNVEESNVISSEKILTEVISQKAEKVIEKIKSLIDAKDNNALLKVSADDWVSAIERDFAIMEICLAYSKPENEKSGEKSSGIFNFTNFHWRMIILSNYDFIKAKERNVIKQLTAEDWRKFLQEDFKYFYSYADEINAWKIFFDSDWVSLLLYYLYEKK